MCQKFRLERRQALIFKRKFSLAKRGRQKFCTFRFFQVCLHFQLRFWERGGKFKSLIILLIDSPPIKPSLYKYNLHDIIQGPDGMIFFFYYSF